MVQIIKDSEGNVTEVKADMTDLLLGNQITARGKTVIVKKPGIFGIGKGVQVIRTEPVKRVKVQIEPPREEKKTKADRIRVNGHDLTQEDIAKMPPEIRRKLGLE